MKEIEDHEDNEDHEDHEAHEDIVYDFETEDAEVMLNDFLKYYFNISTFDKCDEKLETAMFSLKEEILENELDENDIIYFAEANTLIYDNNSLTCLFFQFAKLLLNEGSLDTYSDINPLQHDIPEHLSKYKELIKNALIELDYYKELSDEYSEERGEAILEEINYLERALAMKP